MRLSKMILTIAGVRIKTLDMHDTIRRAKELGLNLPVLSSNSEFFRTAKRFIKTATHKADRANSKRELAFQLNECDGRCRAEGRKHMAWYL
jgi:non-homologous end joining protein Ku